MGVDYQQDDVEIEVDNFLDVYVVYFVDGSKDKDRDLVYCEELGFVIEKLRDGIIL